MGLKIIYGIWIELNDLNWIKLNWFELIWIDLNWIELIWFELNWVELIDLNLIEWLKWMSWTIWISANDWIDWSGVFYVNDLMQYYKKIIQIIEFDTTLNYTPLEGTYTFVYYELTSWSQFHFLDRICIESSSA